MLRLNECDVAICGGVSESIHTFGIFASFRSQGALAEHADPCRASRPFDLHRNGIVVAEGGCVFVAERLDDAQRRATIYGELAGYAMNTDATDFVLPNPDRQAECMELALKRAGLVAEQIDIVSTHATGTTSGDSQECKALRRCSAAPRRRSSTTPRVSSATRWALPGPWSWPATWARSRTASVTPRSTSTSWTPSARWTGWS